MAVLKLATWHDPSHDQKFSDPQSRAVPSCGAVSQAILTIQGNYQSGGWGGVGLVIMARKVRENFLPYCIQNLKICIKISTLLLYNSMMMHFFGYATIITLCFRLMTTRIWSKLKMFAIILLLLLKKLV